MSWVIISAHSLLHYQKRENSHNGRKIVHYGHALPDQYRGRCSQPITGLITGTPMEQLGEGLKELNGIATPQEEQQYQLKGRPQIPRDKTTNQRVHMEGPMALVAYVEEDGFIQHQQEGILLILLRFNALALGKSRSLRQEWGMGEGAPSQMQKGGRDGIGGLHRGNQEVG